MDDEIVHNGIWESCRSKVFVRGYFHSLLYKRLRVPATFLNSPSQLLLFKHFEWLILTGFSLFEHLQVSLGWYLFSFLLSTLEVYWKLFDAKMSQRSRRLPKKYDAFIVNKTFFLWKIIFVLKNSSAFYSYYYHFFSFFLFKACLSNKL